MRDAINYIWVGIPCPVNIEQPQHDLVGPLKMCLVIDHNMTRIRFWCLERYMEHYRELLNGTAIIVSSIESFIHEKFDDSETRIFAEKVGFLVNRVTQDNFQIRACVTAKEAFAFF